MARQITWALGVFLGMASVNTMSRPAVVELYTSEGCSSCPPAEKLLEQLAVRPDVLPLAFHVDYWDGLGWRDRFSMKEATERQRNMSRLVRSSTVGTPQMIVDGRTTVWGASSDGVERALKSPRPDVPLAFERQDSKLRVQAGGPAPREHYDVYLIGYLPKATTSIKRGENAGRTLTEVNVVRYIRRIGASSDSAREWMVSLSDLPADAARIAVILQTHTTGAIVGARTLDLTAAK